MSSPLKIQIIVQDDGSVKVKQFGKEAEAAGAKGETAFKRTGKSLDDMNTRAVSATRSIVAMAAQIAAAWGAYRIASGFLDTAKAFETLNVSLKTITGSAQAAKTAMGWITDFTAKTPYQLDQVSDAFVRLQAQGLDATKNLKMLGDTASAMGKPLIQAVEMFADAVRGENERLKEFGVVAKDMGDQVAYNWSQNGKNMTITANKNAEDATKALSTIFERFSGGMEEQSRTWTGMMSNMSDQWTLFKQDLMDSGPFDALKIYLEEIMDLLDELRAAGKFDVWAADIASAIVSSMETAVLAVGYLLEAIRGVGVAALTVQKAYLAIEELALRTKLALNAGTPGERQVREDLIATQQTIVDVQNAITALTQKNEDANDTIFKLAARLREAGAAGKKMGTTLDTVVVSASKKMSASFQESAEDAKHLEKALRAVELAARSIVWKDIINMPEHDFVLEGHNEKTIIEVEFILTGMEEAEDQLKNFYGLLEDIGKDIDKTFRGQSFGDSLAQGINNAVISMQELNDMYTRQAKKLKEIEDARKAADAIEDNKEKIKALNALREREIRVHEEMIDSQITGYRQLFGTTKEMFAENSRARDVMHKAELAMSAIEIAMGLQKALMNAVVAVTTQGQGDPYTAFARVAAMAVMMGAILSQVGVAFSGGGGGSAPAAEPVKAASTVLGAAAGTASESINKSYEMLKEFHSEEYGELQKIYAELQDLNQNITGLVTAVIKTGIAGNVDTRKDWNSAIEDIHRSVLTGFNSIYSALTLDPAMFVLDKLLGGLVGGLIGSVFGGGGYQEATAAGIAIPETLMADILAGQELMAKFFVSMHKHTDGGWFSSDSDEYWTEYSDLDENVVRLLTKIFKNIGDSFVSLAAGLGVDVQAVYDYIIPLMHLDLKGMSAEDADKAIQAFFANLTDQMAEDLFGDIIKEYQQVGEGLYETAVRLVAQKEIVLDVLEMTGQAFAGFADDTRPMEQQAVALSQAMIKAAGDMETLVDAASKYYDAFFSDAEKQDRLHQQLTDSFARLSEQYDDINITLPETREGYRALVEGLDLTTESGMETYVALLKLAEASDAYYDSLEDALETIVEAQRKIGGTEKEGMLADIAATYGIDPSAMTTQWMQSAVDAFMGMKPEEIVAALEGTGISVETFTKHILFLSGILDEAAESAAAQAAAQQNAISAIEAAQKKLKGTTDYDDVIAKYGLGGLDTSELQAIVDAFKNGGSDAVYDYLHALGMSDDEIVALTGHILTLNDGLEAQRQAYENNVLSIEEAQKKLKGVSEYADVISKYNLQGVGAKELRDIIDAFTNGDVDAIIKYLEALGFTPEMIDALTKDILTLNDGLESVLQSIQDQIDEFNGVSATQRIKEKYNMADYTDAQVIEVIRQLYAMGAEALWDYLTITLKMTEEAAKQLLGEMKTFTSTFNAAAKAVSSFTNEWVQKWGLIHDAIKAAREKITELRKVQDDDSIGTGQFIDTTEKYKRYMGNNTDADSINAFIDKIMRNYDSQAIYSMARMMGVTVEELMDDLVLMAQYLADVSDIIAEAKETLGAKSDADKMKDLEALFGPLTSGNIDGLIHQFLNSSVDEITRFADSLGISVEDLIDHLEFMKTYIEDITDTIAGIKERLNDQSDIEKLGDLEAIFGNLNAEKVQQLIQQFLDFSVDEIIAWAGLLGISVEDLGAHLEWLKGYFEKGEDAVQSFMEQLAEFDAAMARIESNLKRVIDSIAKYNWKIATGGSSSEYLMSQIQAILALENPTMTDLETLSQLMAQWHSAASAEGRAAWEAEQNAQAGWWETISKLEELVDAVDDTIKSIKYSDLNVGIPRAVLQEAEQDYQALKAAAQSGTADDVKEFLSFASTYLGEAQNVHKSSAEYQDIYAQVMADIESMRGRAKSGQYDEQVWHEPTGGAEVRPEWQGQAAINAQFEALLATLNSMTTHLRNELILTIDWQNFDGTTQDVLEMLESLISEFGWESSVVIEWISDMSSWAAQKGDLDAAIEMMDYIATNSESWNSAASLTFAIGFMTDPNTTLEDSISFIDAIIGKLGGWESPEALEFIANIASNVGTAQQLTSMVDTIVAASGGWESTATLELLANLNAKDLTVGELIAEATRIADLSGGWESTATQTFLANLQSQGIDTSTFEYLTQPHKVESSNAITGQYVNGGAGTIGNFNNLTSPHNVGSSNTVSGYYTNRGISVEELWALTNGVSLGTTLKAYVEAAVVGAVQAEASLDPAMVLHLGAINSNTLGTKNWMPSIYSMLQSINQHVINAETHAYLLNQKWLGTPIKVSGVGGYAEGGIVSSPTLGLIGEAGYPEAVIPMKDGLNIPVKWIGKPEADENPKPITIVVQVAGKEFEADVKTWADDVIVARAKRGKLGDTRRYYG